MCTEDLVYLNSGLISCSLSDGSNSCSNAFDRICITIDPLLSGLMQACFITCVSQCCCATFCLHNLPGQHPPEEMASALPPALFHAVFADKDSTTDVTRWPLESEEFYWGKLVEHCPYQSVYAEDNAPQPLIDIIPINLSQTPREQCEIMGLIEDPSQLSHNGPGQHVILHGLVNQQQLNGAIGRLLPQTGRGAPTPPPRAMRVAVRLTDLTILHVREQNITYYPDPAVHVPTPAVNIPAPPTTAAPRPASAKRTRHNPNASLPPPTGQLAELVRADVRRGAIPMLLCRDNLIQAGRSDSAIMCVTCRDASQDGYVALHRTARYSSTPIPDEVRLSCVDCTIRAAQAAHVPLNADLVGKFVDVHCMEGGDACRILKGLPMFNSGHGQFY